MMAFQDFTLNLKYWNEEWKEGKRERWSSWEVSTGSGKDTGPASWVCFSQHGDDTIYPDLMKVKDLGCFFPFSLTHRSYHADILMSVKQHCLSHLHPGGSPLHTDWKFLSMSVCLFFTYQSVSLSQVTLDFPHVLVSKCCSVCLIRRQ